MDNTLNNSTSNMSNEDLKAWMESHPKEYVEMAMRMGEADLLEMFIMGQAAFLASPEFQKRMEYMIDTDTVNVEELVDILRQSGFAEKVLTNPGGDEDWEKYRMPFAAWLKNGKMPEMVIENIEDAISYSMIMCNIQWTQNPKDLQGLHQTILRRIENRRISLMSYNGEPNCRRNRLHVEERE